MHALTSQIKKGCHYRQGDVLIEQISQIPVTAKSQNKATCITLAHGEVTGHHHTLVTNDPAEWWKTAEPAGELFVSLSSGGLVKHPEHAAIELSAGLYRIIRQREYFPEAIRDVAD